MASIHVEHPLKTLLKLKGSSKFSLKSYEALLESGVSASPQDLKMYSACEDPKGFLDALFMRGYVPTTLDLVDNVEDETLFEALYEHAPPKIQGEALSSILERVIKMKYPLMFVIKIAPSLGSKAGKLGLSLPEHALFFSEFIEMQPEAITVDFLRLLHNSGVDFNSPAFWRENFFGQTILDRRFDLAYFMADHGARFSKTGASYMMNTSNKPRLQEFVGLRAWRVLRHFLPGLVDANSHLYEYPSDIVNYQIVKSVVDSITADLFPKS